MDRGRNEEHDQGRQGHERISGQHVEALDQLPQEAHVESTGRKELACQAQETCKQASSIPEIQVKALVGPRKLGNLHSPKRYGAGSYFNDKGHAKLSNATSNHSPLRHKLDWTKLSSEIDSYVKRRLSSRLMSERSRHFKKIMREHFARQ